MQSYASSRLSHRHLSEQFRHRRLSLHVVSAPGVDARTSMTKGFL